jgi:general secretion pathway protein N
MAVALAATMPLRLVLPDGQFTARAVSGSIWSGELADVRLGGVALGTMRTAYRPLARLHVANDSGLVATIGAGGQVDGLNGSVATSGALAPFPVESLEFRQVRLVVDESGCQKAAGRIRLTLAAAGAGLPVGTAMIGALRCDKGELTTRLSSQSGLDTIDFRLRQNRQFQAIMTVRPASADAANQLQALGFRQAATGFQLTVSGQL